MRMKEVLSTPKSAITFHDDFSNLLIDAHQHGRSKDAVMKTAKYYGVLLPKAFTDAKKKLCEIDDVEKETEHKTEEIPTVNLTRLDPRKMVKNENGSYVAHYFESTKDFTPKLNKKKIQSTSSMKTKNKSSAKIKSLDNVKVNVVGDSKLLAGSTSNENKLLSKAVKIKKTSPTKTRKMQTANDKKKVHPKEEKASKLLEDSTTDEDEPLAKKALKKSVAIQHGSELKLSETTTSDENLSLSGKQKTHKTSPATTSSMQTRNKTSENKRHINFADKDDVVYTKKTKSESDSSIPPVGYMSRSTSSNTLTSREE